MVENYLVENQATKVKNTERSMATYILKLSKIKLKKKKDVKRETTF